MYSKPVSNSETPMTADGSETSGSDARQPLTGILGNRQIANFEPETTVDSVLAEEFSDMVNQTYSEESSLNIDDLRCDESEYEEEAAEEVPSYSVRKPGKYEFFRVNPDPKYKIHVAIIDDREDREGVHLVLPSVKILLDRSDFETCTLSTYAPRKGGVY